MHLKWLIKLTEQISKQYTSELQMAQSFGYGLQTSCNIKYPLLI